MSKFRFCASSVAGIVATIAMTTTATAASVTFNKDVLPILQANCQTCHRPGEVAPMSLLTYSDARPWAKAIKGAVATRKMPPWFAAPEFNGHFSSQMTLTEAEIATLVSWVDSGAAEGDPKDKPAPRVFYDGWNVRPDVVVKMPQAFVLPTKGTLNYKSVLIKTDFPEDMWVTAAEVRPGNTKVVHHERVVVRLPGSHQMEKAVPGVVYDTVLDRDILGKGMANDEGGDILGKFNPGLGAQDFSVEGSAKFVPKGSDLIFELHYTADGKEESDVSSVALQLAKAPPTSRKYYYTSGPSAGNLMIPAGDPNAEVAAEATVGLDNIHLVYMQPHMHLRGKDMEVRAIYPTGEMQTLLKTKFDFNWQEGYQFKEPVPLPKGTRLISIIHYDNSANNPYNPDASKEIVHGPQNWDEMGNLFVGVTMNLNDDGNRVFHKTGASLLKRVPGVAGPPVSALNLPVMSALK
jgi:mono/diheme cytochrome c family protein